MLSKSRAPLRCSPDEAEGDAEVDKDGAAYPSPPKRQRRKGETLHATGTLGFAASVVGSELVPLTQQAPGNADDAHTPSWDGCDTSLWKMWAGIINNLKFCHPESGDDIGSPPPDNMDAFRHRAGDFANLWFALLTCMGETPDGSEWRLPGISMMYGSGKTTVGQGTLSAVQQPAVQGMLREKVEAMPPGLNRLRTRARLCQLLCLMSATGPNTIGARTRYRDRNDTLRLSRGNVVYVHVNLHRCSTWREVVMALHIAVSTIQDFHMLDHPVLRLVLDILASNTTQFVPHDVAAAAACVGGVFVHFDEVGTLSSEAAQALCSHCRLCAGTVKFVPLYFLCTGRVLPLPCGAESPSDVYRLVALSLMTKDHIRILLQWVLRTHGIEMTGVDRAVRFAVGEHTSPHFNLTLFVDKVHEGTGGAPRLVLICHLSLVFRVLYRPGGLQFRLDPTAIVDHASEEIQKHRRRELYDVQGLVAGSPLRQGFKVALMCAMTKTRVTDRTVFEPTGCVTLATLMRHAPVFTSAVPGEGGDSVVVVAPDFALQLIKQALILPDEQALIRCVRSPYTRADEIDRLFELAAAFSINTALIEDSLCGVLASGCPLAECFPFLQGTKVAAQVIFPASTTMQDMPTVSASTKNPQVSMLPCNLASFLQSRPAGYYVPLEWNSESADAYVVVGHGVDRSIVAFQYKAGDSSAATITVLRNELATASCQPPTTVPMVFVLLCQLGIGPELTPFIGDADALRLGPGEWQLGNVRKGSLSLPCLLNSTSGQLLCCGGGHVPCEGGTPILIGGITFHYNFDKSLHEQLHTATFIPTESSVPVVVPDLVEVVVPTKSATRAFLGARRSKALDSLKDRSKEPIDTFRALLQGDVLVATVGGERTSYTYEDMRRSLRRFGFWGAYSDSDSFANFVTTMGKVTRTWIEFNPTKGSVNPLSSVLAPLWAYATVDTFVLATHLRLLGAVSVADWWSLPPATLTEPATGILSTALRRVGLRVQRAQPLWFLKKRRRKTTPPSF